MTCHLDQGRSTLGIQVGRDQWSVYQYNMTQILNLFGQNITWSLISDKWFNIVGPQFIWKCQLKPHLWIRGQELLSFWNLKCPLGSDGFRWVPLMAAAVRLLLAWDCLDGSQACNPCALLDGDEQEDDDENVQILLLSMIHSETNFWLARFLNCQQQVGWGTWRDYALPCLLWSCLTKCPTERWPGKYVSSHCLLWVLFSPSMPGKI